MKDRIDEEIVGYIWWLRPVSERQTAPVARLPHRRRAGAADPQRPGATSHVGAGRRAAAGGAAGKPVSAPSRGQQQQQPPRVGGDDADPKTVRRDRAEGRPQRSVSVRERQEIQEVSRRRGIAR